LSADLSNLGLSWYLIPEQVLLGESAGASHDLRATRARDEFAFLV
jgi:hypothetical protein